jgi:hypothetical protein
MAFQLDYGKFIKNENFRKSIGVIRKKKSHLEQQAILIRTEKSYWIMAINQTAHKEMPLPLLIFPGGNNTRIQLIANNQSNRIDVNPQ